MPFQMPNLFNDKHMKAHTIQPPYSILYVGKISAQKGVAQLITSLNYLSLAPSELTLTLVGGSSSRAEYDQCKTLASECKYKVEFCGALPQDKLPKLYTKADLFVLPSFFEGLPLVIIEALACGNQVVCTNLAGVKDWTDAVLDNAPIRYVDLPKMLNENTPDPDALKDFECRLARAIEQSLLNPAPLVKTEHLSWKNLALRILSFNA